MNETGAREPLALRPLGIGEIFDRTVTIYVRNFAALTLIVLAVAFPFGGLEYLLDKSNSQSYQQLIQVIQHPETAKSQKQQPQQFSSEDSLALLGIVIFFGLLAPVGAVATAIAVWKIYNGQTATWTECYAQAFRRFGSIVATAICGVGIIFVSAFVAMVAAFIPMFVGALVFRTSAGVGIALFILTALLFIAWFVLVLLLMLCVAFAFCGIGIEKLGFGGALGRAFGRIFNRHELGKATLVAIAVGAVNIGLSIVGVSLEILLVWLVHSQIVDALAQTAIALIQWSFIGVLFAVYYLDARVRQEGLDVYEELDRLQAQTAT